MVTFLLGHCNVRKQWILEEVLRKWSFGGISYCSNWFLQGSAILALMAGHFDIKLIPEFNGSGFFIEWMEKAQMVCDLCGLKQVEWLLPLWLTFGTFAVYLQLIQEDKTDATWIKKPLYMSFVTDAFTAYEHFMSRRLQWPGKKWPLIIWCYFEWTIVTFYLDIATWGSSGF